VLVATSWGWVDAGAVSVGVLFAASPGPGTEIWVVGGVQEGAASRQKNAPWRGARANIERSSKKRKERD